MNRNFSEGRLKTFMEAMDRDIAAIRKLLSFVPLYALDVYLPSFKIFSSHLLDVQLRKVVESFSLDIFLNNKVHSHQT